MKLKDLLEMSPYWPQGEKPPEHWKKVLNVFYNERVLYRSFTYIDNVELSREVRDIKIISFYIRDGLSTIYGGYKDKNEEGEEGLRVIFTLEFKAKSTLKNYPKDIDRKSIQQVKKVNTDEDFQDLGIAMFVYQALIRRGVTILSDITQLDGGRGLWKKMARLSHVNDYVIRVIDDEDGYQKDNKGEIIEYNGKNIDTHDIWTTGLDFSGQHVLLIMMSKKI